MFSSVKSKILATTISVIVGFVALALIILWSVVHNFAAEEIERDLVSGRQTYERYQAQHLEMLARKAITVSKAPYLIATLSEPDLDEQTAAAALDDLRDAAGRSRVVLLNSSGEYVAGTTGRHRFGDSLSAEPGVERALAGEVTESYWGGTDPVFVAIAPILAGRELVGAVALAERLDRSFADEMRIVTGRDIVVVADGRMLAESWQRTGATTHAHEIADLTSFEGTRSRRSESFETTLAGELRFALAIPLPNGRGHIYLSRAVDELLVVATRSWMWFLLAGLLVAVLGILASLAVARRLSNPLARLMVASDSFASGNFDAAVDIQTSDEVGRLAQSFNSMARRIERLIRDVQASAIRAGEANRAKDRFMTSVSHELRTPLTGIYAYAELLLSYGSERDSEEVEFLNVIHRETQRLMQLVDDVMELTSLDAESDRWSLHTIEITELVREVANGHREELQRRDIQCSVDCRDGKIFVEADRVHLKGVLDRVFANARAFSSDGTSIQFVIACSDDVVSVRVVDHGPGIEDESKSKVFDRFVQLGDSLTDKPKGAGLGLAISRQVVEAHGGTIHCEDTPGGGATMVVTLPESNATVDTRSSTPHAVALSTT